MRAIFLFLLLVHGLIHLTGFAKAFKLADIPQLTLPITRTAGALWLLAALLFITAAVLSGLQNNYWWVLAIPAVVLSQALIIGAWPDAKFGTIINVIAIAGIVLGWANWNFQGLAAQERLALLAAKNTLTTDQISAEHLAGLPPVIQRWLTQAGVIGQPRIHTIHLQQRGTMRTGPDGQWMPFVAEQYFTTDPPGFVWTADVQMMPLLRLKGIDIYRKGQGHMRIKALALVPVVNAAGPEIDQGTLLRYLGEICWFPTAALHDYIRWEQINEHTAQATMHYGEVTASGIFTFDTAGDMQSFTANRYYERKGGATLERWHIQNTAIGERNGLRMPVQSEVTWQLEEGNYTWLRLEIAEIRYND